jgi:hypothetical protein
MEGKLKTSVHEHAGSRNKNTSAAHPTPESFADRFLADNYVTYMPSLSGSMGEMTLGGGTRLMTDASVSKYSEDIADRNMTKTTRQQKPAGERNMDNTVNLNDNEGNDNEDVDQTIEWAPGMSTAF